MAKLTKAQVRFLKRVHAFDGFLACRFADMRSHGALLKEGMIALTYSDGTHLNSTHGYVLTPAGRAALQEAGR